MSGRCRSGRHIHHSSSSWYQKMDDIIDLKSKEPERNFLSFREINSLFHHHRLTGMDIEIRGFRISVASVVAEFGGTAVLLFVGCLGCLPNFIPYQPAVSFGMGLITAIQIFGHISGGHFNPAVTVASFFFNKCSLGVGIIYILAQLLGAIAGFSLAMFVAPEEYGTRETGSTFCNTIPAVDDPQSFLTEFICTFLLILLCCSVWDGRSKGNRDSFGLKLGLFLFAIVHLAGPMTGASLNPARTFGPSVINNNWDLHWMYWVAPVLAGILGALFYKYLLLERKNTGGSTY